MSNWKETFPHRFLSVWETETGELGIELLLVLFRGFHIAHTKVLHRLQHYKNKNYDKAITVLSPTGMVTWFQKTHSLCGGSYISACPRQRPRTRSERCSPVAVDNRTADSGHTAHSADLVSPSSSCLRTA